ncbi:hypothetical protein GVH93_10425, partial [Escherichia coli]
AENSALYMTGCGLHCRQALLPRDRHSAPETQRLPPAPDEASLWSRQRKSKVTPYNIPPQAAPVLACVLFPPSDMPFGALSVQSKGEKDRYRGGHDAPEIPLLRQAVCTAYSLKLPKPQQSATPA